MKRYKLPRGIWLLSVVLTLVLSAAVACGGAAEPATPSPTKIAEVTVPDTPVPAVEAAPEATVAPTAITMETSITKEFPLVPDWTAGSIFRNTVLEMVGRSVAGSWDLHACACLYSCQIPSSRRFNGWWSTIRWTPRKSSVTWQVVGRLARMGRSTPLGSMTPRGTTACRSPLMT